MDNAQEGVAPLYLPGVEMFNNIFHAGRGSHAPMVAFAAKGLTLDDPIFGEYKNVVRGVIVTLCPLWAMCGRDKEYIDAAWSAALSGFEGQTLHEIAIRLDTMLSDPLEDEMKHLRGDPRYASVRCALNDVALAMCMVIHPALLSLANFCKKVDKDATATDRTTTVP